MRWDAKVRAGFESSAVTCQSLQLFHHLHFLRQKLFSCFLLHFPPGPRPRLLHRPP